MRSLAHTTELALDGFICAGLSPGKQYTTSSAHAHPIHARDLSITTTATYLLIHIHRPRIRMDQTDLITKHPQNNLTYIRIHPASKQVYPPTQRNMFQEQALEIPARQGTRTHALRRKMTRRIKHNNSTNRTLTVLAQHNSTQLNSQNKT